MKRFHPKSTAIADGAIRPRHISPPPDDDRWLRDKRAGFAWRLVQTTVEDLEQRPAFSRWDRPFDPNCQRWKEFKMALQNGDELWLFRSPKKFWNMGFGNEGVLLVRNNEPFISYITAFN